MKSSQGTGVAIERCSIEVFAEDPFEELAYCRGMITPKLKRLRILWLGRTEERHAHDRVRGKRTVRGPCAGVTPEDQKPVPQNEVRTLPEAVFGLAAAIGELLGGDTVELQ